jgi:hypothetical protein
MPCCIPSSLEFKNNSILSCHRKRKCFTTHNKETASSLCIHVGPTYVCLHIGYVCVYIYVCACVWVRYKIKYKTSLCGSN